MAARKFLAICTEGCLEQLQIALAPGSSAGRDLNTCDARALQVPQRHGERTMTDLAMRAAQRADLNVRSADSLLERSDKLQYLRRALMEAGAL